MSRKILFVDDEPNILEGYQRQLRKVFEVDVAVGGAAGLRASLKTGPYAVIVSDMHMPEMSGIEFLSKAQTLAKHTVRMMLTGNADQQTAIDAVNEGQIFRFLTKPCSIEMLVRALEAGVEQYRLVNAEAELLEKTLLGSVGVLVEILGIAEPTAYEQARRLRKYVQEVAPILNLQDKWQLELAALLSPVGRMTLPPELLAKRRSGAALSEGEQETMARVPEIGHNLLVKIPRLAPVAQIVRYHRTHYCVTTGSRKTDVTGKEIPVGARVLKILSDFIEIEANHTPRSLAFRLMATRKGWYDPALLSVIAAYFNPPLDVLVPEDIGQAVRKRMEKNVKGKADVGDGEEQDEWLEIKFEELLEGDVLMSDIQATDGTRLLAEGNIITEELLAKLKNYVRVKGVREPVRVAIIEEQYAES
jgi:response regulator RpfG family c-di-GMP phosphodiesterase